MGNVNSIHHLRPLNRACKQQIETCTQAADRNTDHNVDTPIHLAVHPSHSGSKVFVAMPPQGERKFALLIDNGDDDIHDHGARQTVVAAPPMEETPTKGNNRARIIHRHIRRGSVYELTELLKDKIHLGPRPTPTKRKMRHVDDMEGDDVSHKEWVVLETGKVRELAEYLKDKIPMCFPGSARPGRKEADNMPTKLSFEDLLMDKIPNLRSSRTKNEAPRLRRAHSEMPTTSVLDLAMLLQDKIHMRSPLDKRSGDYLGEEDDGSTSCCKENCRCCRQLAKLLSCLEAVVGNRLLVQLNDEEGHEDEEDATQSSIPDEQDHTLFIPRSKSRGARTCRLSPATSASGDGAMKVAASAGNGAISVATGTPTPLDKATQDDTAQVAMPLKQSMREDPVPATVQKVPIPVASPATERSSSSSCESDSGTSKWSIVDDTESTMSTSESHSDHDFSEVTGSVQSSMSNNETKPRTQRILPSWKCSNAEYERRLKTEYVLTSKKLCSQRDSALLGLDSVPWDRSRYGTWRQQNRQVERKNEHPWA
jgi:hypothetical protein